MTKYFKYSDKRIPSKKLILWTLDITMLTRSLLFCGQCLVCDTQAEHHLKQRRLHTLINLQIVSGKPPNYVYILCHLDSPLDQRYSPHHYSFHSHQNALPWALGSFGILLALLHDLHQEQNRICNSYFKRFKFVRSFSCTILI